MTVKEKIEQGKTSLGIEFGSTRIKAVLTDDSFAPVADGAYEWENCLENGYWTYSLADIHIGVRECYAALAENVRQRYGAELVTVGAIGISGMMHGYLAFDEENRLLVPFRTWRNVTAAAAAEKLTEAFAFNIPQRWSIAHLYQAILDNEPHVPQIRHITTLAGYIHFLLTGERALGVGEASGMFPIENGGYHKGMLEKFRSMIADKGYDWDIADVLPQVQSAGAAGACLTESGAKFLDSSGKLKAGIPLCPPEGDAGTGMVATNSIAPATGNISAGTSIFSMLVLEKPLKNFYSEIDVVTTPDGLPVAMVHCNNCCSELDIWVKMFGEFAELSGLKMSKAELYELLYKNALCGAADGGGITAYNFISGEPIVGVEEGKPLLYRASDSRSSLADFFRAQIYSALASLKLGNDILFEKEGIAARQFLAHGGLFKVGGVAQQFLADGLKTPIAVMRTAGEGGAWGMALLAAYMVRGGAKTLAAFLDEDVFDGMEKQTLAPDEEGARGFEQFIQRYKEGLSHIWG